MVKGGFAYLLLTETMMIAALDPNGFRPLSIGQMNNGAYVVASETCALETVGARFIQDVAPGEVVIISDEGLKIEVLHYGSPTGDLRNGIYLFCTTRFKYCWS